MQGKVDAGGDVLVVGDFGEEKCVALWVELEDAGELVFRGSSEVVAVLFPFAGEALLGERFERVAELGHSGAGEF